MYYASFSILIPRRGAHFMSVEQYELDKELEVLKEKFKDISLRKEKAVQAPTNIKPPILHASSKKLTSNGLSFEACRQENARLKAMKICQQRVEFNKLMLKEIKEWNVFQIKEYMERNFDYSKNNGFDEKLTIKMLCLYFENNIIHYKKAKCYLESMAFDKTYLYLTLWLFCASPLLKECKNIENINDENDKLFVKMLLLKVDPYLSEVLCVCLEENYFTFLQIGSLKFDFSRIVEQEIQRPLLAISDFYQDDYLQKNINAREVLSETEIDRFTNNEITLYQKLMHSAVNKTKEVENIMANSVSTGTAVNMEEIVERLLHYLNEIKNIRDIMEPIRTRSERTVFRLEIKTVIENLFLKFKTLSLKFNKIQTSINEMVERAIMPHGNTICTKDNKTIIYRKRIERNDVDECFSKIHLNDCQELIQSLDNTFNQLITNVRTKLAKEGEDDKPIVTSANGEKVLEEARIDTKNLLDLYDKYDEAVSHFCHLKYKLPKEIKEQGKKKNKFV